MKNGILLQMLSTNICTKFARISRKTCELKVRLNSNKSKIIRHSNSIKLFLTSIYLLKLLLQRICFRTQTRMALMASNHLESSDKSNRVLGSALIEYYGTPNAHDLKQISHAEKKLVTSIY